MTSALNAFVFACLVAASTGTPVRPATVEDRVQQLEDTAELEHEVINRLDTRLAILEKFVEDLLEVNASDAQPLNGTSFENLQEKLSNQLSQMTNATTPLLFGNAANRAALGTHVAFHAYSSANRVFSPNEVIMFDTTALNTGNGYTDSDGIFDAPASGVYVFTWTVETNQYNTHPLTTNLIVDGDTRGVLTSDADFRVGLNAGSGVGAHPATGVVVTYVQAGDHVFLRLINHSGLTSTLESNSLSRSTFSGWLLF